MRLKEKFHLMSMPKISAVLIAAFFLISCGDNSQQGSEKKTQATEMPKAGINSALMSAQINSAPLFESQQGWGAGYVKAIGHGPGVVVGPGANNLNVFAQQFPAKTNEPFKVVARASSVDKPKAMGRFQINWLTPESKFISASIKAFEVTPEEKTFEYEVIAPAGPVAGTLNVVPDGPEDVVRYTEMRLLGKETKAKTN